jgi:hypothetical protein
MPYKEHQKSPCRGSDNKNSKKKEKKSFKAYLEPVPENAKLLKTNVRIIASTATVTIKGNQLEAIGASASLVLFKAVPAVTVMPELAWNLSRVSIPIPRIIPTSTSISTS